VGSSPRQSSFGGPAALWIAAFVWWTTSGLASALNTRQWSSSAGLPLGWDHALRTSLVGSWAWVPLTVLVVWLARRHPLERGCWRRSLPVLAAGCVAVIVVRAGIVALANPWVGWYPELPPFGAVLITSVANNLFVYWMLVGVAHALHYAERSRQRELEASRLEAQLAQARLGALQAQLQPHFLFNTLQSIAELVHRDPDAADQMIVQLGGLLRRTLDTAGAHAAPLRDELAFLEPYLAIEQVRFGPRLTVAWDIAPDALAATVPQLILQPLVENALRHGIAPRAAPGHLLIAARLDGERLALEVRDDGVGAARPTTVGVGLANTRARLRQHYGDDHCFTLASAPGGGTVARIEIPRSLAA
jgi:signal transduction histidine kinase